MTEIEQAHGDLSIEVGSLRPHGPDVWDWVPDVGRESLQVVKDQIAGLPPTTALGVLVDRRRPIEVLTIAGLIGIPILEVEWTIEILEEDGFCHTYEDDGIKMVELAHDWD